MTPGTTSGNGTQITELMGEMQWWTSIQLR